MRLSTPRGSAALLSCLAAGCASTDGIDERGEGSIDLASVSIDTRAAPSAADDALAPAGADQYLLVQLDGPPTAEDLAALSAKVDRV